MSIGLVLLKILYTLFVNIIWFELVIEFTSLCLTWCFKFNYKIKTITDVVFSTSSERVINILQAIKKVDSLKLHYRCLLLRHLTHNNKKI